MRSAWGAVLVLSLALLSACQFESQSGSLTLSRAKMGLNDSGDTGGGGIIGTPIGGGGGGGPSVGSMVFFVSRNGLMVDRLDPGTQVNALSQPIAQGLAHRSDLLTVYARYWDASAGQFTQDASIKLELMSQPFSVCFVQPPTGAPSSAAYPVFTVQASQLGTCVFRASLGYAAGAPGSELQLAIEDPARIEIRAKYGKDDVGVLPTSVVGVPVGVIPLLAFHVYDSSGQEVFNDPVTATIAAGSDSSCVLASVPATGAAMSGLLTMGSGSCNIDAVSVAGLHFSTTLTRVSTLSTIRIRKDMTGSGPIVTGTTQTLWIGGALQAYADALDVLGQMVPVPLPMVWGLSGGGTTQLPAATQGRVGEFLGARAGNMTASATPAGSAVPVGSFVLSVKASPLVVTVQDPTSASVSYANLVDLPSGDTYTVRVTASGLTAQIQVAEDVPPGTCLVSHLTGSAGPVYSVKGLTPGAGICSFRVTINGRSDIPAVTVNFNVVSPRVTTTTTTTSMPPGPGDDCQIQNGYFGQPVAYIISCSGGRPPGGSGWQTNCGACLECSALGKIGAIDVPCLGSGPGGI